MIIKIIDYGFEAVGTVHRSTASRKALMAGLAVGSYVLELDANAVVEGATSELPQNVAHYVTDDAGKVERIEDSITFNLPGNTAEEQIIAFGFLVATYGITSLRHIVFSYGQDSVTPQMAARHRDLLLKILGAMNYPAIYAMHGDTGYDHGHLALCLIDIETGKRGDWAQGFEIEALHIAAAICVYQDQLQAEPNRRYVADETGVYHTWSGIRVAGADGTIPNRGVFKKIHAAQIAFEKAVKPGPGLWAGQPLDTSDAARLLARGAVRLLAKGAVQEEKSWDALHRSLARVGLRYEPSYKKGEIEGGYIVPNVNQALNPSRLKGSDVNAGYGRLVEKLRGPYQPPPPGLKVQPFLHPTYRGLDDEEPEEKRARSLKREQSAKLEEEIDKLAAHLKRERERQDEDERILADAEKAKLEKDRSAKLAVHNARQRAQKARREADEELLAGLKVSAQQSGAKSKRGRRTKAKPIPGVFWGDPDPKNQAAADWRQRYVIETNGPKTTYSVNQAAAFVETKNFVAMHTPDRQAAMDALRCAHEKFGRVKITGTPQFRREMILLALEMEIPLDIRHTIEAQKLRKQVAQAKEKADRDAAEKAGKVIYEAKASTHRANVRAAHHADPKIFERKQRPAEAQQQDVVAEVRSTSGDAVAKPALSPASQSELPRSPSTDRRANPRPAKPSPVPLRLTQEEKADIAARKARASIFTDAELDRLFERNQHDDRTYGKQLAARYALTRFKSTPFDELLLTSSTFVSAETNIRYLDDEVLLKHFEKHVEMLVRPEIQAHLAAFAAVHQVRRQWIMSQCAAGKISRDGTVFDVNDDLAEEHKHWLVPFIKGQASDPTFFREVDDAQANPDAVLGIRLDLRPELTLWQRERANKLRDEDFARFIADELFRTSTPEEREKILKQIPKEEAAALSQTSGPWADGYRRRFYPKPRRKTKNWKNSRFNLGPNEHGGNKGR